MEALATLKHLLRLDLVKQAKDTEQLALIAGAAAEETECDDWQIQAAYRHLAKATMHLAAAKDSLS